MNVATNYKLSFLTLLFQISFVVCGLFSGKLHAIQNIDFGSPAEKEWLSRLEQVSLKHVLIEIDYTFPDPTFLTYEFLTDGKENWAGERAFLKGLNQGMSHKFLFDSSVYSEVEYRNGEQDTSSFAIRRKRSSDRDRYRENFFDPRLIGRCPAPIGVWYNVELDRILCAPRKEKEVVETVDDFEHGSVTVVSFAPEKGYDYAKMFFSEKTGDLLKIVAWYSLPDCELVDEVVFSNHSENHNSLPLALKLTRRENEKLLFESKVKIAHASDTIPHDHRFSWKFFDLLIGTKIYDQTTERPREREWNGEEIVASSSTNPKPVVENGK